MTVQPRPAKAAVGRHVPPHTTWMLSYQAAAIREKFDIKLVRLQWENIPFAYEESKGLKELKAAFLHARLAQG